ncbi:MAG: hypothetical protein WD825_02315 [Gemmatimonadaceae bacterium]
MKSSGAGSVVTNTGSLVGEWLLSLSRAWTVKAYVVSWSNGMQYVGPATEAHVNVNDSEFRVRTAWPSMKMVSQISGPSSVDTHESDACVGPASSTCTTGVVGAAIWPGSVTVTALLDLDVFPAASQA